MLVYRYYISTLYILTSTSRFRQHIASFLYENEILLSYQQQNQIKSINVIIFCCTSVYFPFIYDDGAQPARHREKKGISLSMNTMIFVHIVLLYRQRRGAVSILQLLPCISHHSYTTMGHNRLREKKGIGTIYEYYYHFLFHIILVLNRQRRGAISSIFQLSFFSAVQKTSRMEPARVRIFRYSIVCIREEQYVLKRLGEAQQRLHLNGLLHGYYDTTHRDSEAYRKSQPQDESIVAFVVAVGSYCWYTIMITVSGCRSFLQTSYT